MPENHQHRAGGLRQSNKRNKRSKASKRSISRHAGGKVNNGGGGGKSTSSTIASSMLAQSKAGRKNFAQQKRDTKRQELLRKKRGGIPSTLIQQSSLSSTTSTSHFTNNNTSKFRQLPPTRLVGIISLSPNHNQLEDRMLNILINGADKVAKPFSPSIDDDDDDVKDEITNTKIVTCNYEKFKKEGRITYVTCNSFRTGGSESNNSNDCRYDVMAALDMARVCDMIVFVLDGNANKLEATIGEIQFPQQLQQQSCDQSMKSNKTSTTSRTNQQDWDHLVSDRGDRILTAIKGQGLPTPLTVLAHTEADPADYAISADHMTVQSTKSLHRSKIKRSLDIKRYVHRFSITEFGTEHDKIVEVNFYDTAGTSGNRDYNNDDEDDDDDLSNMDEEIPMSVQNDQVTTSDVKTIGQDVAKLIRTVCTMSCTPAKWIALSPRSYIVSDQYKYNAQSKELSIIGYIRGTTPFDVNSLIHIPNVGTYACKCVQRAIQPLSFAASRQHTRIQQQGKSNTDCTDIDGNKDVDCVDDNIVYSDPTMRDSLHMYATPDALDGEQNLIGFYEADDMNDEDDDNNDGTDTKQLRQARPAGWSDYQAAWLGGGIDDDLSKDDDTFNIKDEIADHGELADELNRKSSEVISNVPSERDIGTTGSTIMNIDDANDYSMTERNALIQQRKKQQQDDLEFPDEVQGNEDVKAFDRFARYRSLKTFRKSAWDPKENLPESYANIYHFSSFKQTQRTVFNDLKELINEAEVVNNNSFWGSSPKNISTTGNMDDGEDDEMINNDDDSENYLKGCVPRGSYVNLTIENVSEESLETIQSQKSLLTAVTLLEHENKVSVLHMGLSQSSSCDSTKDDPIKSKDVLTFRCGWRTWQARPVFSQNNLNCDKHKFERFMPICNSYFAASVFGPVTYSPCPVLVFRMSADKQTTTNDNVRICTSISSGQLNNESCNSSELVAIGSTFGADADRIVIKRIILTGYPVRVHKRFATVKYMFYNPEDVKWFKPAGLYTKHGLQGNIVQSVGEHGTMKCLFNAPIKQHDTVCLPLYKRIFPKYVHEKESSSLVVL